jgi:hypothetical protein
MPWAFDETVAQIELLFLSLTDLVLIEDNECVDDKERCSCMERRCRRVAAFRGTGSPRWWKEADVTRMADPCQQMALGVAPRNPLT